MIKNSTAMSIFARQNMIFFKLYAPAGAASSNPGFKEQTARRHGSVGRNNELPPPLQKKKKKIVTLVVVSLDV